MKWTHCGRCSLGKDCTGCPVSPSYEENKQEKRRTTMEYVVSLTEFNVEAENMDEAYEKAVEFIRDFRPKDLIAEIQER